MNDIEYQKLFIRIRNDLNKSKFNGYFFFLIILINVAITIGIIIIFGYNYIYKSFKKKILEPFENRIISKFTNIYNNLLEAKGLWSDNISIDKIKKIFGIQ